MKENPKRIPNIEVIGWIATMTLISMFAAIGLLVTIMEVKEFFNN
jgi:hypothetical protein